MVIDPFQVSILERFRKQQTWLGSIVLTLFLAGWLNLLVQPCLMAAPGNDRHDAAINHQPAFQSGSSSILPDLDGIEPLILMDCESLGGCADLDDSNPVIPSLDPEKKFLASAVTAVQFQPGPVSLSLPNINQKPLFPRVPLFIQNCAFLI